MNKYIDFLHGIPTTDSNWHFLSATFARYDIHSLTNTYAQVDQTQLTPYQFVEITDDNPINTYTVIVGQNLYGYVRQIRIHQNWLPVLTNIGNDVLPAASCKQYGYDFTGTLYPVCPFCSNLPLDTSDMNTCYMLGSDSSYGISE